jgi:hypothetical protein
LLGIGARVAGRAAIQGIDAATSAPTAAANRDVVPPQTDAGGFSRDSAAAILATRAARKNLSRGVGGFFRPFMRVGGILWLEVTGSLFLLLALVLLSGLWRIRPAHASGPYTSGFLVTAAITVMFLYMGVSSFWRARKR